MRTSLRTEAVRAVQKVLFMHSFEDHRHRLLDEFVLDRRYAERSLLSTVLRDPDPAYRGRCVPAAPKALGQAAPACTGAARARPHARAGLPRDSRSRRVGSTGPPRPPPPPDPLGVWQSETPRP